MSSLKISDTLSLPSDAVTQKIAALGRTGSGKTYFATKLAEEMLDLGAQIVALDPVGVWYGLRLAKNGKDAGFPIPVFGGLHGDIPLEATGGALMANLIVDQNICAVIDVSQMISAEQVRFTTEFATRLFERRKAKPAAMMLFLEECQEFIPQNPMKGDERMLHSFQRLVKIGRNFGIGACLISQRPQEVNKKVLNMTECLFAFQMTGPQERRAIRDWVADKDLDVNVVDALPKLAVGHAHVWSPQWLKKSEQVHISEKRTFNASSTPELGKAAKTRELAPIELERIRADMASVIERAKAEDPKELHRQIAELKRQLAAKPAAVAAEPINKEQIEKRIKAAADTARDRAKAAISKSVAAAVRDAVALQKSVETMRAKLEALDAEVRDTAAYLAEPTIIQRPQKALPVPNTVREERTRPTTERSGGLAPVEQRILDALAELGALGSPAPPRVQVAFLAGYSNLNSKGFTNAIGVLRSAGLIDYPNAGSISLTHEGCGRARFVGMPRDAEELQQRLLSLLDPVHARILKPLIKAYPDAIERERVAEAAGYTNLNSKGFTNSIGRLRSLGFIDYPQPGWIAAQPVLFMETGGGTNG